MYTVKQGGRVDYNYMEIFLDTEDELKDILKTKAYENICPGSIAYVISTGAVYILNSEKEWVLQGEEN